MYRVRHYGQLIHPDNFNVGALGFAIRSLNWVRWKLETFNQRLVLRYMVQDQVIDETRKKSIYKKFGIDVKAEKVEKELTSPTLQAETEPVEMHLRAERYRQGGHAHAADKAVEEVAEAPPVRPFSLDELASRMTATGRAKRYIRDRTHPIVIEADFEAVPPERIGGEEYGQRGSSAEGSIEEVDSSNARYSPHPRWARPT
jgi:hypothetical protein